MADQEVDAAALAVDADTLGKAGGEVTEAADALIAAHRLAAEAFGDTPAQEAFADVCSTWLKGCDSIGTHVAWIATYTQRLANAFGAVDRSLIETYTTVKSPSDLPPVIIDNTDPSSDNYNPYLA